ncbi:hypothetical protein EKK58_06005 [Candidatus Dependentiae bacterium]|nr:MAG: hypothetical protein EKK58_06005 [Candidatus Dependentiae bacterium]
MREKKIKHIKIIRGVDYDADLSDYGKFSNSEGEYSIKHNGGNNSYRYFNAENVYNMEEARENYERVMSYERGEWYSMYIKAEATLYTSCHENSWLINKIHSGGVYGYESDGDEDYLKDEENSQLNELKDVLLTLGFTDDEIKNAEVIRDYK